MSKRTEDAFCPNCEWTGDATGITQCPACGAELTLLDALDDERTMKSGQERYPSEILAGVNEPEDEYVE